MRLFQELGYEHVSVSQIAAEAGVSVPTFYAHFAGKEQIVLQLASGEAIAAVLAEQPTDLPLGERIRRAAPRWLARYGPDERADLLARWRIIATTPSLRLRAGEYERTTAARLVESLPPAADPSVVSVDSVVATAHLAAFTVAFLTWAESNGERELEDVVEEAFRALRQS